LFGQEGLCKVIKEVLEKVSFGKTLGRDRINATIDANCAIN